MNQIDRKQTQSQPAPLAIRIFLILLLAEFGFLGVNFRRLPPVVPLYYSLPWGEEQLANIIYLFIIPASAILFFSINLILSFTILKKELVLVQILMWTTVFVTLLGFITLLRIVLLVI